MYVSVAYIQMYCIIYQIDALVKRQSCAVEPAVTDIAATAATEKDKPDEKGKGGKGDSKKGKDKGDKKARK